MHYPTLRKRGAQTKFNRGAQPRAALYFQLMDDQQLIAHQKNELARAAHIVRLQMAEIDRLRNEVDRLLRWINGDADALTTLQSVYLNPDATDANRVKAAASALPFERPKVSVNVNVGPALLGKRIDQMKTIEPTIIEHQSSR